MESNWFRHDIKTTGRTVCRAALAALGIVALFIFHITAERVVIDFLKMIGFDDLIIIAGTPLILWIVEGTMVAWLIIEIVRFLGERLHD